MTQQQTTTRHAAPAAQHEPEDPRVMRIGEHEVLLPMEEAKTLWDLERCFTERQLEHWARLLQGWDGPGLPPIDDVLLFIWRCRATGLDPWLQQVVGVYRKDGDRGQKLAIQTTVEGYVVVALRSGLLVSLGEPVYSDKIVTVEKSTKYSTKKITGPEWAKCTVVRWNKDLQREVPITFRAKLADFAKPTNFWEEAPEHMLGNIRATGRAVKLAFLDLLSGVGIEGDDDDDVRIAAERDQEQPAARPAPAKQDLPRPMTAAGRMPAPTAANVAAAGKRSL